MKATFILFCFLLVSFGSSSFKDSTETIHYSSEFSESAINWLTWEEAMEQNAKLKKKIMVDVYTIWCGWCKRMDKATFQQAHIAKYVNENYYAVKFDAEQTEEIVFKNKTFKFVKNGRRGYHELAAEITRGRLSYPTVVFIDENLEVIQPVPGYKDPEQFEQIITYFGRNEHMKTPWESYQRSYQPLSKED